MGVNQFVLEETGRVFRTASSDRPGLFCCWSVNARLGSSWSGSIGFGSWVFVFWQCQWVLERGNVEAAHNHEHNHGFSEYCAAVGTERGFESRPSVRGAQKVVLYAILLTSARDQGATEGGGRGGASGHKLRRVSQHPTFTLAAH